MYSFGFGRNRDLKSLIQASSGPAPRISIKKKANAMLAQRTTKSCQSCAANALRVPIAAKIRKIHFAGMRRKNWTFGYRVTKAANTAKCSAPDPDNPVRAFNPQRDKINVGTSSKRT